MHDCIRLQTKCSIIPIQIQAHDIYTHQILALFNVISYSMHTFWIWFYWHFFFFSNNRTQTRRKENNTNTHTKRTPNKYQENCADLSIWKTFDPSSSLWKNFQTDSNSTLVQQQYTSHYLCHILLQSCFTIISYNIMFDIVQFDCISRMYSFINCTMKIV